MFSDLLCFSHLRWNFVWQRPQHLMTRASAHRRVWFIEEPMDTDGTSYMDIRPVADQVAVAVPYLSTSLSKHERVRTQSTLVRQMRGTDEAALLWYYTPMAREFSRELEATAVVYDCMDELSAFAGAPPALRLWETELLAAADVVFTGGVSLFEHKRARHPHVFAFPSAVEVDHFRGARKPLPDPAPQRWVPRPRIGFAGVLDERLDRDLLDHVAKVRPACAFVLVGPVVKIDPASLPQRGNLYYVGIQPYQDLPAFMAHWDAAILPFARNDATRFISPTKTPEYLAAGLPVVSTSIRDVVHPYGVDGLVQIADEPDEFAQALDRALRPASPGWLASVDAHLSGMSWERTWSQMDYHIRRAEAARSRAATPATLADVAHRPAASESPGNIDAGVR